MSLNTQLSSSPPALLPHDEQKQKEIQRELSKLLRGLKHDLTLCGIFHLGGDGVMRSLTADREVVDAVALRPELVKAFLDRFPYDPQREINYRGADGTKVPREKWFHPDKSDLPPPHVVPEERRNQSPEQLEENRQMLEEAAARNENYEYTVVSNHDLGF